MDKPICDGGGGGAVVKERTPILEGQIGGDYRRGSEIPLVDDLVEQVGAARIEAEVSQLVDEQQVVGRPRRESFAERVASLGTDEIVDEVGGESEADTVAFDAREVSESIGEVSFSNAARAHEDDVGALADEGERGGALDEIAVDLLRAREVVRVECGHGEQARPLDGGAGALFEVHTELVSHEVVHDGRGGVVAGNGFLEGSVEALGRVIEAERAQDIGERERGRQVTGRRARRCVRQGRLRRSGERGRRWALSG